MEKQAIGRDGRFHSISELTPEEVSAWKKGLVDADKIYKREHDLRTAGIPLNITEIMLDYERRIKKA